MLGKLMLLLTGGLVLAGCSDGGQLPAATTSQAGTPSASSTPTADPYDAYLANVPKGEKTLSREDAALRAKLGCGKTYPPGTTDAVLADAYRDYCK